MKQLFLKSNLLHIRTNEGEFEVSNPEVVHTSPLVQFHRKWNEGDEVEWPYGVELIQLCRCGWKVQVLKQPSPGPCACMGGTPEMKVARLIPEEKKKPVFIPEDHPFAANSTNEQDVRY